jgi:ubiquinone/menaquinone biosynthesis C-methylase UbiE
LFGRIIARLMNVHNAGMNAFAVQQLDLNPSDRVLEIGFGGGVTLPSLVQWASFVGGVDRSEYAVDRASKLFAEAISNNRADFRQGTVESIPFESCFFNKACTVNTVYFWKSLEAGFREIHRVLHPGGRLVVGFLPKEHMDRMNMPSDIFTMRTPQEVVDAMTRAGFTGIRIERPKPTTAWNVIVATAT